MEAGGVGSKEIHPETMWQAREGDRSWHWGNGQEGADARGRTSESKTRQDMQLAGWGE